MIVFLPGQIATAADVNANFAELAARLDPVHVTIPSTDAAVTTATLTIKNRRALLYVAYQGDSIGALAAWESKVLGTVPAGYRPSAGQPCLVPFHPTWLGGVSPAGTITLTPSAAETHTGGSYALSFTWDLD